MSIGLEFQPSFCNLYPSATTESTEDLCDFAKLLSIFSHFLGYTVSTVSLDLSKSYTTSVIMMILSAAPTMLMQSLTIKWDTHPELVETEF